MTPKKSNTTILEHLLRAWSISALCAAMVATAWSASKMGIRPVWLASGMSVVLLACSTLCIMKHARKSIRIACVSCTIFSGVMIALAPKLSLVNAWIDSSLEDIGFETGMHSAADIEEEGEMLDPLDIDDSHYDDVAVGDVIGRLEFVVSFNTSGMAIIDIDGARKLKNDTGHYLLAEFPNGNYLIKPWVKYDNHRMKEVRIDGDEMIVVRELDSPRSIHHWGTIMNGIYHAPDMTFAHIPDETSERIGGLYAKCDPALRRRDLLTMYDLRSEAIVKTIDILKSISEAGPEHEPLRKMIRNCEDPLHINDARVIRTAVQASMFHGASIGDVLISMRNPGSLAVIDGETGAVVWHMIGKADGLFTMQHSPRMTDRGTLVVFDNVGSNEENGISRIVELDPVNKTLIGVYEAQDGEYFGSLFRGKIDVLTDEIYVVQEQGSNGRGVISTFFLLCENGEISNACRRQDIFNMPIPKHYFNNAIFGVKPR